MGLEMAVHDEGVDVALRGVVEGAWQTAHDFEAEFLPEADGLFICADDNIELHGAKASCSGVVERMGAHGAGDASARCPICGHVSAVGYVAASALLVGAQIVGSEDFSVFFRDKCFVMGCVPVFEGVLAREVAREGVGFSGADGGFEDLPHCVSVHHGGRANGNHIQQNRCREHGGTHRLFFSIHCELELFWKYAGWEPSRALSKNLETGERPEASCHQRLLETFCIWAVHV